MGFERCHSTRVARAAFVGVFVSACAEPVPFAPPDPGGTVAEVAGSAAAPLPTPTWTARKPTGATDPTLRDEWNRDPEGPVAPARTCTQRGCGSWSAEVRGALAPEDAAQGSHVFTIVAEGRSSTCKVEVTSTTRATIQTCGDERIATVGPKMQQVERREGGVVAVREEALPGMFEWSVRLPGEPASVHVIHQFGGRTVLDTTAKLRYAPTYPNGPGCEPACFRAVAEIPPPALRAPSGASARPPPK